MILPQPVESPINLGTTNASFYKNIPYDDSKETVFDIFLPKSKSPTALVMFIHGGGFIGGDKSDPLRGPGSIEMIKTFLSNNIAFATINYTLLNSQSTQGVLECLNDSKRALQFMRYNAKTLNIDKNNVVLMGASAGAGTSLWIGFHDEMAQKDATDPVMRESTRVKGIVVMSTQSTYAINSWAEKVFFPFKAQGLTQDYIVEKIGKARIMNFYGITNWSEIYSAKTMEYSAAVDMLDMMSSDDPEFYVMNQGRPDTFPKTTGELNHHPLHSKALMDEAAKKGVKGKFIIDGMKINTTKGESRENFVIRILRGK
ncbi:MAG: carboxylesterase family protein [Chitinophagaceae bacterium]|nr:carboxylesterase family protein [Chitinophagaceae bacterium]